MQATVNRENEAKGLAGGKGYIPIVIGKKTQKDNMKNKNENRVTVELYDGYLQS